MLSESAGSMPCTGLSGQSERLYTIYVFIVFYFAHILEAAKAREELLASLRNI